MKRNHFGIAALLLSLFAVAASSQKAPGEDWVSLFNGQDLTGWTKNGNRYRARLNGVQMVDFTDPKPKSFDGPIALQLHAGGRGNMKFRDIMIRDLSNR